MTHTKGKLELCADRFSVKVRDKGYIIADCFNGGLDETEIMGNAKHLVKCWNSHDELVEALKSILFRYKKIAPEDQFIIKKAEKLLKELK